MHAVKCSLHVYAFPHMPATAATSTSNGTLHVRVSRYHAHLPKHRSTILLLSCFCHALLSYDQLRICTSTVILHIMFPPPCTPSRERSCFNALQPLKKNQFVKTPPSPPQTHTHQKAQPRPATTRALETHLHNHHQPPSRHASLPELTCYYCLLHQIPASYTDKMTMQAFQREGCEFVLN